MPRPASRPTRSSAATSPRTSFRCTWCTRSPATAANDLPLADTTGPLRAGGLGLIGLLLRRVQVRRRRFRRGLVLLRDPSVVAGAENPNCDVAVRRLLLHGLGESRRVLLVVGRLADYLRANDALIKCLVLSATTHPADAQLVTGKFALYGVNRLALTTLDETVQPGAAVGIAAEAELPLVYLSAGQRVPEDLERATPLTLADYVVRSKAFTTAA